MICFFDWVSVTAMIGIVVFDHSQACQQIKIIDEQRQDAVTEVIASDWLPDTVKTDGEGHVLDFANGMHVSIQPVRFEAPPGEGFMAVSFRCGLLLKEPALDDPQLLTTVGIGRTELLSCDGLVDMAAVEIGAGTSHVGLIYDLSTPNTSFRAAMIVSRGDSPGSWVVDNTLSSEERIPPGTNTIAALKAVFVSGAR